MIVIMITIVITISYMLLGLGVQHMLVKMNHRNKDIIFFNIMLWWLVLLMFSSDSNA